ncbi:MAG: efflux transporter outer membrane subunit [Verrucomicrobiota bacterium]
MHSRQLILRLSVAALFCMIAGCAVGPNFSRPEPRQYKNYVNGGDPTATVRADGTAQTFDQNAKLPADWWGLFHCPKLDDVIIEALADNPGLQAAQANLRQSQDLLRSGYGIFYPQVDGAFAATRQRYTPLKVGQNLQPSIFNLFTLSASASYALDVFGGERRLVEGLAAQADLEQNTERAAYLTLSANIANAMIAQAAYRAEIEATEQLIELQDRQVQLAKVQAQAGTAPYSSVLTLQSQLASDKATIPQLRQRLDQTDDLLASLVGHTPAEWKAPRIDFAEITLPSNLPVSLPSDLTRQRPDILAAEATLHAASANIGVATAAMLPSVTLSGAYGANNTSPGQLTAANATFWGLAANATTPVFEGGTLWYKRKAALDNYRESAALYQQTVLGAFAQVADALRAVQHDAEILEAQGEAVDAAQKALHLVQANFQAGLANYSDVMIADVQYHQARIADLQTIASRYQDTVALFVALGGGWWNAK